MKEIADRIKEARLAKGMTQEDLAKALGLKSRSSINKMEKDAYEIGLDRLKEIAKALDVDADYLVFGDIAPDSDNANESRLLSAFHKLDATDKADLIKYAEFKLTDGKYKKASRELA